MLVINPGPLPGFFKRLRIRTMVLSSSNYFSRTFPWTVNWYALPCCVFCINLLFENWRRSLDIQRSISSRCIFEKKSMLFCHQSESTRAPILFLDFCNVFPCLLWFLFDLENRLQLLSIALFVPMLFSSSSARAAWSKINLPAGTACYASRLAVQWEEVSVQVLCFFPLLYCNKCS